MEVKASPEGDLVSGFSSDHHWLELRVDSAVVGHREMGVGLLCPLRLIIIVPVLMDAVDL